MARKVHGVRGLVLACLLLLQDRGHKGVSIARRVHGVRGLPERANKFWPASYPCMTGGSGLGQHGKKGAWS